MLHAVLDTVQHYNKTSSSYVVYTHNYVLFNAVVVGYEMYVTQTHTNIDNIYLQNGIRVHTTSYVHSKVKTSLIPRLSPQKYHHTTITMYPPSLCTYHPTIYTHHHYTPSHHAYIYPPSTPPLTIYPPHTPYHRISTDFTLI